MGDSGTGFGDSSAPSLWNKVQPTVDAAYDFPARRPPAVKLMFATTPRCGSHFVCNLFQETRRAGLPLEYFHPRHFDSWAARTAAPSSHKVLSELVRHRTGPNGCFSAKLHWPHLTSMFDRGIAGWLRGSVWIRIERLDSLAQAVSWDIARQTGVWIHGQKAWRRPVYDRARITTSLLDILRQRRCWEAFFQRSGIVPQVIVYEEVCRHGGIAGHLDRLPPAAEAAAWPVLPQPQRQATEINDVWIARYLEDVGAEALERISLERAPN